MKENIGKNIKLISENFSEKYNDKFSEYLKIYDDENDCDINNIKKINNIKNKIFSGSSPEKVNTIILFVDMPNSFYYNCSENKKKIEEIEENIKRNKIINDKISFHTDECDDCGVFFFSFLNKSVLINYLNKLNFECVVLFDTTQSAQTQQTTINNTANNVINNTNIIIDKKYEEIWYKKIIKGILIGVLTGVFIVIIEFLFSHLCYTYFPILFIYLKILKIF